MNALDFYHKNHIGAVVPVGENKKALTLKGWEKYNSHNTYTDTIEKGVNYTVVLDKDIAVVDLDLKFIANCEVKDRIKDYLLNDPLYQNTFIVETPTGGMHFYFRVREEFKRPGSQLSGISLFYPLTIVDLPHNVIIPGSSIDGKPYKILHKSKPTVVDSLTDLKLYTIDKKDPSEQAIKKLINEGILKKARGGYLAEPVIGGRRNNTAHTFGVKCAVSGLKITDAWLLFEAYILTSFSDWVSFSDEAKKCIDSAYDWYEREQENKKEKRPLNQTIIEYFDRIGYQFRYNTIRDIKEYRQGTNETFKPLKENTAAFLAVSIGIEEQKMISIDAVRNIIDFIIYENEYDPCKVFIDSIEATENNALDTFCKNIDTDIDKDFLYWHLRLWFCESMYVLAQKTVDNNKANHVCLAFYGPQNVGKTSLARMIVPEQLKSYYILGDLVSHRDYQSLIAENAFIILDDIDTMYKSERKGLKSIMTQTMVSWRKAYRREQTVKPAIANFLATTNTEQFLTDETGNRRYFPVYVKGIKWDKIRESLIHKIWQQAKYDLVNDKVHELRKATEKFKGYRQEHIKQFEAPTGPEEQFMLYFSGVSDGDFNHELLVTSSQLEEAFCFFYDRMDKKKFSTINIGKTLSKMDVDMVRTNRYRLRKIYVDDKNAHNLVKYLKKCHAFNVNGGTPPTPEKETGYGSFDDSIESSPFENVN